MKLIIAGSRHFDSHLYSFDFIRYCFKLFKLSNITEIVSGGAEGIDREGEHFASHMNIPVKLFEANWDKYGKFAGPKRNEEMAKYGDALLLIWDGRSKGSHNMKQNAIKYKLPIYEVIFNKSHE